MSARALLPALLVLAAGARPAAAQYSPAEYNRERAYRHFLSSAAPARSISGAAPAAAWDYATPWEYGRVYRAPVPTRELVTPYRHEFYRGPVWTETEAFPRPVLVLPPPAVGPGLPYPHLR